MSYDHVGYRQLLNQARAPSSRPSESTNKAETVNSTSHVTRRTFLHTTPAIAGLQRPPAQVIERLPRRIDKPRA